MARNFSVNSLLIPFNHVLPENTKQESNYREQLLFPNYTITIFICL